MLHHQKILCIGNETEDTDNLTSKLAAESGMHNHGLISDAKFIPIEPGYYHTTVVDLNEGQIKNISSQFDRVMFLDQSQKSYPHFRSFVRTFRLFKELDSQGVKVDYLQNNNVKNIEFWWNYLRTNSSFCFQPFLSLVPDTDLTNICPKSKIPIKPTVDIVDWVSDPDYRKLRDSMLAGKKLPLHCVDCYDKEKRGIESARQFETLEWATRMELATPDQFNQIDNPVYYEIRPSNKCNLMCRMCDDARSHLLEKERIELNIPLTPYRFKDLSFDQIKLDTVERIYVGGGEPTIMPEFYTFLQKCVDHGRTDFELCIGTNGMKFSNKLLNLLNQFSNVLLSFSFDGHGLVNDYIRWKSKFDVIHRNALLLKSLGHKIGLQTVPSMYNVARLHEIFEFYDQEFPESSCLVQAAEGYNGVLLPWNYPFPEQVVNSMERCQQTNQYLMSGRSLKSYVDQLYNLYSDPDYRCDLVKLKEFFKFNDQLDHSRGCWLGDYIPELEQARKLIIE